MSRVTLNGRVVADEDQWIYDWFGIDAFSPAVIRKAVEDNPAGEDLTLEINSGGGSVFAGFEMYSILKGAKCQTIAEVQSLAASAASTAMVGCSKVMLSPVAQVMIHLPSSYAEGNQEDMERERRALESITQSILNGYELKCREKTDRAHLEELMYAESWLSAQEAVDLGLADGILFQNEDDSSTLPANIINAVGGGTDEGEEIIIGGAGIGAGCESDADADITLEGKVTIVAKAGEGNAAIGDMNGEQEFSGLAEGSSITRYDSEGNDTTLPTDPGYPVPADTSSSGGGSADASVQELVFPGLVVTDKDGQRISYTSTQSGNTLTVCVGRLTASFRISLATLRQLRAEGIETITFQTILCSTTLSVDELLAMGGEDAEIVLTHHIRSSTLTVGGKAV